MNLNRDLEADSALFELLHLSNALSLLIEYSALHEITANEWAGQLGGITCIWLTIKSTEC